MAIETCLTAQRDGSYYLPLVLLHGRVVLKDGSPPPRGFTAMCTCLDSDLSTWHDGTFTFSMAYNKTHEPKWKK
jgi:hypothetical protein